MTVRFLDVFLHIGGLTSQQNCLHKFPLTKKFTARGPQKSSHGGSKKSLLRVRRTEEEDYALYCETVRHVLRRWAENWFLKKLLPLEKRHGDGTIASCEKR